MAQITKGATRTAEGAYKSKGRPFPEVPWQPYSSKIARVHDKETPLGVREELDRDKFHQEISEKLDKWAAIVALPNLPQNVWWQDQILIEKQYFRRDERDGKVHAVHEIAANAAVEAGVRPVMIKHIDQVGKCGLLFCLEVRHVKMRFDEELGVAVPDRVDARNLAFTSMRVTKRREK